MKDGQEHIYYLTGDSRAAIEDSPHLEAFRAKRGYEVLLLADPVDEIWVDAVPAFDGKEFRSIAKGQLDLDAELRDRGRGTRAAPAGLRRAAELVEHRADRAGQGGPAVHPADHLAGLPGRRHP